MSILVKLRINLHASEKLHFQWQTTALWNRRSKGRVGEFLKVRYSCTTAPKGRQIKAFCDVCVPASLIKAEYVQVQVYDLPL